MEPLKNQSDVVFIVDDDAGVREALAALLRARQLNCETFESARAFEEHLSLRRGDFSQWPPTCLLLDVQMPGMDGFTLFDRLAERGVLDVVSVIFLTGHADIPTAVDAVKRGAFDFCEKPPAGNTLYDRVVQGLDRSARALSERARQAAVNSKLAELTEREQQIMRLVIDGMPNKLIADALNISVRTVEVHRARTFEKMGVRSAVDLINTLRPR